MSNTTYDRDFYAWAVEQAALLRAGRFAEVDVQNIAEEIETLGRSEKRELVSRLEVLLLHLLKWEYQPERQGNSWRLTIAEQRDAVAQHLEENPSLMSWRDDALAVAYKSAVRRAARETRLPEDMFPWACVYTVEQVMDVAFWPALP